MRERGEEREGREKGRQRGGRSTCRGIKEQSTKPARCPAQLQLRLWPAGDRSTHTRSMARGQEGGSLTFE